MRRTRRQKGFILLLVVAMIPLLGMAAVILTLNSRQIFTQTRRYAIALDAQLACESGIAWIKTNPVDSLSINQPRVLKIDHDNKIITCTIELTIKTASQTVFTITSYVEDKRFSKKHQQQYVLTN